MIATPEIDEQLYVERFKKYNGLISFMRRKPSSFVFWFIGIYSTIYSLALGSHQITENRVMDTFVKLQTQIGFKPDQYSLRQIAGLSNTKTTSVPKFTQPVTIKDAILGITKYNSTITNVVSRWIESNYQLYGENNVSIVGFRIDSLKVSGWKITDNAPARFLTGSADKVSLNGWIGNGIIFENTEIKNLQINQSIRCYHQMNQCNIEDLEFGNVSVCFDCKWSKNQIGEIAVRKPTVFLCSQIDNLLTYLESENFEVLQCIGKRGNQPINRLSSKFQLYKTVAKHQKIKVKDINEDNICSILSSSSEDIRELIFNDYLRLLKTHNVLF